MASVTSGFVRVLAACSLGGAGHFLPLLPFLEAAQRRGDETLVLGPPALSELVTEKGFAFVAGSGLPEADIAPIREKLAVVSGAEALVLGNRELFGRLAANAMLPSMREIYREWVPRLILREPCEYASTIATAPDGALVVQVAISLAEAEAASIAAAGPALEEHRKSLVDELWASPYLTCFPASLDPSPFPATIRFRHSSQAGRRPLPDWWAGTDDTPLVYVSFGSVLGHMAMAAEVFQTALAAVEGLDARVLLTVGRAFDPSRLGALPPNVHAERWVDQADVLAETSAVVCHAGSGTVCAALAAGVPLVMVPRFADQFENARRVTNARAGTTVETTRAPKTNGRAQGEKDESRRIRVALEEVLSNSSYRRHANRFAREMAALPTAEEVLDLVSAGVETAKSVVPEAP